MPLRRAAASLLILLGSAACAALVSHGLFSEHSSSAFRRWRPQELANDENRISVFDPAIMACYTNALVRLTHPETFVVAQFDDRNYAFNAFVVTNTNNVTCMLDACLWAPEETRHVECMLQLMGFIESTMGMGMGAAYDLDAEDFEYWIWAKERDGWGI